MRRLRRSQRGQAAVEMALIFPLLFLLVLGAADFGRALDLKIEVTGASRAGMRSGIKGGGADIGVAVREEPNSNIANTDANWGLEGPTLGNIYNCDNVSKWCGDPDGCIESSFTASPPQLVCFSVRSCARAAGTDTYDECGDWGVRPAGGSNEAIDVRVVYKYAPLTPLITAYVQGGTFYLPSDTLGVETYPGAGN